MKALVSTDFPNRGAPKKDDFRWTRPGELVGMGLGCCANPSCGCQRSFTGMETRKGTTTAIVVERDPSYVRGTVAQSTRSAFPGINVDSVLRKNDLLLDTVQRLSVGDIVRLKWVPFSNTERPVCVRAGKIPRRKSGSSRDNPKRRNPGTRACPCGCRGVISRHDERAYGPWTCPVCGDDSDTDLGKPCRKCRRKHGTADVRRNSGEGLPGLTHTWITNSGAHVSAGDKVEYWGREGLPHGAKPEKRWAKVLPHLVFDDHVMVARGSFGNYVDDSNFIRVVRRSPR